MYLWTWKDGHFPKLTLPTPPSSRSMLCSDTCSWMKFPSLSWRVWIQGQVWCCAVFSLAEAGRGFLVAGALKHTCVSSSSSSAYIPWTPLCSSPDCYTPPASALAPQPPGRPASAFTRHSSKPVCLPPEFLLVATTTTNPHSRAVRSAYTLHTCAEFLINVLWEWESLCFHKCVSLPMHLSLRHPLVRKPPARLKWISD